MPEDITQECIEELLSETNLLFNHIYWVEQLFDIEPKSKKHRKTSIEFSDIKERTEDFLRELINTTVRWVYSQQKVEDIIEQRLLLTPKDIGNASAFLTTQAFSKFRPNFPQGQLGELLLFNFIQHFFNAVPLLRKQSITTSTGHERFGADAIHFKKENNKNIFILGESKCYKSKYKFSDAFSTSLDSIISSFNNLGKELGLYVYEDFIDKPLVDIAMAYKNGALDNVHFELVCLIAYQENTLPTADSEEEIKAEILKMVEKRCSDIKEETFNGIKQNTLNRIHYIFFPVFEMEKLLNDFSKKVAAKS